MDPNRPCQCQPGWTGRRCENGIVLSVLIIYWAISILHIIVYTMQRDVDKSVKMVESVFFLTIAHVGLTGQDQLVKSVRILCYAITATSHL